MKKALLVLILLFKFLTGTSQDLIHSRTSSHYTIIYQLTNSEAEELIMHEGSTIRQSYFHTLVDFYPIDSSYRKSLAVGHYLFVSSKSDQLEYELKSVNNLELNILNNNRDLLLVFQDKTGAEIKTLEPKLGIRTLSYDNQYQAYRLSKTNREGWVLADFEKHANIYNLKRRYDNRFPIRAKRRILGTFPINHLVSVIRYIPRNIKSLISYRHVDVPGIYYRVRRGLVEKQYQGFVLLNKPTYKRGDSVKIKAMVVTRKGKPVNKKLMVKLIGDYQSPVNRKLGIVSPYRPGLYVFDFVIDDSLNLALDQRYQIDLDDDRYNYYPSGHFKFEAYEIKQNVFSISSAQLQSVSKPGVVFLKGVDSNDLPLYDVNAEIVSISKTVRNFYQPELFIPDTLWRHHVKLDPLGETRVDLPDSIFPKADLDYEVTAIYTNADQERQVKTITLSHNPEAVNIESTLENDSILFRSPIIGKTYSLKVFGIQGDTLFTKNVKLPHREKIEGFMEGFQLMDGPVSVKIVNLREENDLLEVAAQRTKDSLILWLNNPRKILFRYQLFKSNKIVENGSSTTYWVKRKTGSGDRYYISLQYFWAGEPKTQNFDLQFAKKPLTIQVNHPSSVFPGQKVDFSIQVTDAFGKPVHQADLTAFGVTSKFRETPAIQIPYHEKFKNRKAFNEFSRKPIDTQEKQVKLEYDFWKKKLGLDSIEYYHFLYPQNGFYENYSDTEEKITQVAPFVVKNGAPQHVYYVYFDKVLKYYFGAQSMEPYSFQSDTGKVRVSLRLRNQLVTTKIQVNEKERKMIFSIDLDHLLPGTTVTEQPPELTDEEIALLKPHFLTVERDGQSHAYFQQGSSFHLLDPFDNTNQIELTGPFFPGSVKYESGFKHNFIFKPGMKYKFEPRIIDRETAPYDFGNNLPYYAGKASLNDQVLTKKEIDEFWKRTEIKTAYSFRKYPTENSLSKKVGSLSLKESETRTSDQRVATFLINLDRPDEYYIYPGFRLDFDHLTPGLYQAVIIYKDEKYLRPGPVWVRPFGRTFFNVSAEKMNPPDSFSIEVMNKIRRWSVQSVYVEQNRMFEMQELRKLYYREAATYASYIGGRWMSGRVTSAEDGTPVPGVNVIVKGTTYGTVTNAEGEYGIYVPIDGVLVFSFIGFSTEEINTGYRNHVDVGMAADVQQLSEIVVTAYGVESSRKHLSASVATVNSGLLSGRVAGVQISGTPGATDSISIQIRGARSLMGTNTPLVIIDGVISRIESIDEKRITAIEVIKGEQAMAIYGSRAMHGVILISTKPGTTRTQLLEAKLPEAPQLIGLDGNIPGSSLRKNFKDDAFWQPKLTTDRNGLANFRTTFPDDITSWNIYVVGLASKNRSGIVSSRILSFKPLMAQLAIPNFLVEGDSATALAKITNYTQDSISVNNSLTINSTVQREGQLTISNSFMDSINMVGSGDSLKIKYSITHKTYLDGEERKIPVYPRGSKESKGIFTALIRDTTFNIQFDRGLGSVKLYAETDLLDVLLDEIEILKVYPYDCNEQLASKLKAFLAEKLIRNYRKEKFTHDKSIEKIIKKLIANQGIDGGWSWWGSKEGTIWITRQIAEALHGAEKTGYQVRYDRSGLRAFLLRSTAKSYGEERLKNLIYLAGEGEYVLAKEFIDSLSKEIPAAKNYHKLLAQRLLQLTGGNPNWTWIVSEKKQTLKGNWYWGEDKLSLSNNTIDNTLLVYQLMEKRNENDPNLYRLRNYFLEKRNRGWANTYESSRIIEVLLPALIRSRGKGENPTLLISGDTSVKVTEFPFQRELKNVRSFTVTKTGDAPVYFSAYQQFWNIHPEKVSRDFIVQSEWENSAKKLRTGKPVLLEVSLEVKKDAEYVMITVPIPAGCSYESKDQSWSNGEVHREYDIQETRIYCQNLPVGKYHYTIKLQPRFKGKYQLNPAKAEWMYFPVIFGREEMKRLEID